MLSDNGRVFLDNGQVLSDNGIWLIGREEAGEGRSWGGKKLGEAKEGREDIQSFFARTLHPRNPVIFLLNRRIPIYKDVMPKNFSLSLIFEQTMRE